MFSKGLHVIGRCDKFWGGLGADLVIEQTLMRSLKTASGLTRGGGMEELQRGRWTLSLPLVSEYSQYMEEATGLAYSTSEQHTDTSSTKTNRDHEDTAKVPAFLKDFSPYSYTDDSLHNIVSGVEADDNVNVHEMRSLGQKIVNDMDNKDVFTYSFSRRDKAKTMSEKSKVPCGDQAGRPIDPALLFQRLLVIANAGTDKIELDDVMRYELSTFPPTLFENSFIPREAQKYVLMTDKENYSNTKEIKGVCYSKPDTDVFVSDVGSLLRRISWKEKQTFGDIIKAHTSFVKGTYGKATVIFDGYSCGPSINDMTHVRRQGNHKSNSIDFTSNTIFNGNQEDFLCNTVNKEKLISSLSLELQNQGCKAIVCDGDADVTIVQTAIYSGAKSLVRIQIFLCCFCIMLKNLNSTCTFVVIRKKRMLLIKFLEHLIFLLAFTGCDSTLKIFKITKSAVFKKLISNQDFLS